MGALVVEASTRENRTTELMRDHLSLRGVAGRPELALVDRAGSPRPLPALGGKRGSRLTLKW